MPDAAIELLRVRTDPDGAGSALESMLWQLDPSVVPQRSASIDIEDAHFRRVPERSLGPHRAPRRQLVVILAGNLEITSSDGSKAVLGPGAVLLADDTEGIGHSVSSAGADLLVLPLLPSAGKSPAI
ncbi:MAG: hypothetical protein WAM97_19435 [Acidimicrobiales bacterium]